MKLLHVAIEGIGRFGTPARLDGFGPGVNILAAPNEAGKSTLFRAIRACLFERHNTTRDDIRQLATEGLSLSAKVSLGFEHQGKTYELTKSFLKSAAASLRRDGIEIARNHEADETVWNLFGIVPGKTVDPSTYGVLWVEQGQSVRVPVPSEAAISTLNAAIQQEVGTLAGGERARQLLKNVNEELELLLTGTGRRKTGGPLDTAQRQFETVEEQRIAAERRLAELDGNLDTLVKLRAELVRLDDPSELRLRLDELNATKATLDAAEKSASVLQHAETDERRAFALLEAQDETLEILRRRASSIDENRSCINSLTEESESISKALTKIREELGSAVTLKNGHERDIERFDTEDRRLQRLAAVAVKAQELKSMSSRLERLQSYEKRFIENGRALLSISADEAALKALAAIEAEINMIGLRMEAQAAHLTIDVGHTAQVIVNGEHLNQDLSRAVTEPLVIRVGADVSITVSPPPASLIAMETASREQQAKLRDLLKAHGAASPDELRQLRDERIELEKESRQLKSDRIALGLKDASAAHEIMQQQIAIKQLEADTEKVLAESEANELPSPAQIDWQRQELRDARGVSRAALAETGSQISSLTEKVTEGDQALASLSGQLKVLQANTGDQLALLPDARRHALLEEAGRERDARAASHRASAAVLAEKRSLTVAPEELERLRALYMKREEANENHLKQQEKLRLEIANLEGQIQSVGGDGLGERVAELQAESAVALAEVERQAERAEVLQLLQRVVDDAYAKRHEQINAPLHRHLKPFLQDVFPQAEVAFGEKFSVEGLKRSGPGSEIFGRLSWGTQEQVAVLVRLAIGAMIAENGHDVPVILDDALVYSDDARIEQMFDAINRAGRNQQVIVFTCRAKSFEGLQGNVLRIA